MNNNETTNPKNGDSGTRRKKRRWGDAPPPSAATAADTSNSTTTNNNAANASSSPATSSSTPADPKARAAALQASIQARLAALKARTAGAVTTTSSTTTATPLATQTPTIATISNNKKRTVISASNNANNTNANNNNNDKNPKSTKRARVFELDMSTTAPTRLLEKQQHEEQLRLQGEKEKVNPYLAHREVVVVSAAPSAVAGGAVDGAETGTRDPSITTDINVLNKQTPKQPSSINNNNNAITTDNDNTAILDTRLAGGHVAKTRQRHRPMTFVTPGTYIALGEKKRQAAARAEESGYVSGRKVGTVITSVGMGGGVTGSGSTVVENGGAAAKGVGSYYGVGEAGKVVEQRLPARVDAPELEVEEVIGKSGRRLHADGRAAVAASVLAAESAMPYAMEWWDAELLPSKLRKELASEEGKMIASKARKQVVSLGSDNMTTSESQQQQQLQKEQHQKLIERCYKHASLTNSRTHSLLQHPIPILTPAQRAAQAANANKPSTLHLTKAERKRHRKLRRAERLREQQDMQAAGLIPPPEPRLTLSNYMKVLGDQAVLDPSRMEAHVQEQIQARKMKHEQMNEERKLTKEEKALKHARKLQEDTSQSVSVALFWVRDMSHPYHRAKVDLNAQQNGITGGVLECENPRNLALVVAEGGEKAIKRYIRLMTVRMRWKGEDFYVSDEEEEEEEDVAMTGEGGETTGGDGDGQPSKQQPQKQKKFNPNNECELIWTGMAVKRAFHSFMFQSAANATVARKILEAKTVAHYWDLAMAHVERKDCGGMVVGGGGDVRFRLGCDDDHDMS